MSKERSSAARELAKVGAAKGGRARANVLTPEERSEIARRASRARWGKTKEPDETSVEDVVVTAEEMPYSMFRGTLDIGDVTFECHVTNDHRRLLTAGEVVRVISGGRDSSNLVRYLERNPMYEPKMLRGRTVQFRIPGNPQIANGYDASLLVEICEMYLKARAAKLLKPSQQRLAVTAEIVVRACAKVGIIALVDEATGYQQVREKQALQLKLQAYIADDMSEWVKMFPDEFWYELARLESIRYSPRHRPLRWGKYVMAFVYDAVDGDVGAELRKKNPHPHFKQNHHQWLKSHGKDALHRQIGGVIAVMKMCDDMTEFRNRFAKVFQKNAQMSFDDLLGGSGM
jgi:P63C domain